MNRALPPLDYRIVQQIQSSPQMSQEQGAGWMGQYGGPSGFVSLDKPGLGDVYNAIANGIPTDQLPIVTGLPDREVSGHLTTLQSMGLVEVMEPV